MDPVVAPQPLDIETLSAYLNCPRLSIFLQKGIPENEINVERKTLEECTIKAVKKFHELWTDAVSGKRISEPRLKLNLENIEKILPNKFFNEPEFRKIVHQFEERMKLILSGKAGLIKTIKDQCNSLGSECDGINLIESIFFGDPAFDLPIQWEQYKGTIDCLIAEENGFMLSIYAYEPNLPLDPFPWHKFKAETLAYLYNLTESIPCKSIQVNYLGGKTFDFRFNAKEFEKNLGEIYEKFIRLIRIGEIPPFKEIPLCTRCILNKYCQKQIHINDASPETDGLLESAIDAENLDFQNIEDNIPNGIIAESTPLISAQPMDPPIDINVNVKVIPSPIDSKTTSSVISEEIEAKIVANPRIYQKSPEIPLDQDLGDIPELIPTRSLSETQPIIDDLEKLYIGRIIQAEKSPFKLSAESDNTLAGAIRQEHNRQVFPGQILIAENPKDRDKVAAIVELIDINSFPHTVSSHFAKLDLFNIEINTRPFMYYEKTHYSRVLYPENLSSHMFRLPNDAELFKILHLHNKGIPLGIVTYDNYQEELPAKILPYYFPFDEVEVGYKGIFIVGSPGKGKTNFLKLFADGIANYVTPKDKQKPTLIIFDLEGQFDDLTSPTTRFSPKDEELWDKLKIKTCPNTNIIKIRYQNSDGSHTLALNMIDPEFLTLFFPELPPKSANNFKRMAQEIFKTSPYISYSDFVDEIKSKMESDDLAPPIQKAIMNALINGPSDYFDQGGNVLSIDHLMVPGQVISIQINHIVNPLPVLLYILMLLNKRKLFEGDLHPVLLMIDEVHRLFPHGGGDAYDHDYLIRIASHLIQIARRGRKKRLGMIFASQQPHDVIPDIVGVFQTKIVMGLEAASTNWIKEYIGRQYVQTILHLPRGIARIKNTEIHSENLVPILMPKAPNKHEGEE